MTKAEASDLLDRARAGEHFDAETIRDALVACGDLAEDSPPMMPLACAPISVVRSHLNAGTRLMRDPDAPEPMPAPAGCAWDRPADGWIDLRRWRQ